MARCGMLFLLFATATPFKAVALSNCRCTDTFNSCWPSHESWQEFNESVHGRLVGGQAARSPLHACEEDAENTQCSVALNRSASTEYWNQQFPGGFQSSGLMYGWSAVPSDYAVEVLSAADVQKAVLFASQYNLRVAVKGAGHDYMGRNTARVRGSLMISTIKMKGLTWAADGTSVTVQAGVVWEDVYLTAQARGRYVQGGHCPTVGAAGGWPLGAGYGPFSRYYGSGADNMISAEVVLASGDIVVANETSNPDLFWALRGGGGGTFGIVTSLTHRTHAAPTFGGSVSGRVECPAETAFEELMVHFVSFLPALFTPHWANSVMPSSADLSISIGVSYVELSHADAQATWDPFDRIVNNSTCSWQSRLSFNPLPTMSGPDGKDILRIFPTSGMHHSHTGVPAIDQHVVSDGFLGQMNQWSLGQAHRYIPRKDFENQPEEVAQKLVKLTKLKTTYRVLQLSKALAGAGNAGSNTSAHPLVREAGVALMGNEHVANYFPQLPQTRETLLMLVKNGGVSWFFQGGFCPMPYASFSSACLSSSAISSAGFDQTEACWYQIEKCFRHRSQEFHTKYIPALRSAFPTGSYHNEGDYFEKEWQSMFWGSNYASLLRVKQQVDPTGLFVCWMCVGSEYWTPDGNCRLPTNSSVYGQIVVV